MGYENVSVLNDVMFVWSGLLNRNTAFVCGKWQFFEGKFEKFCGKHSGKWLQKCLKFNSFGDNCFV